MNTKFDFFFIMELSEIRNHLLMTSIPPPLLREDAYFSEKKNQSPLKDSIKNFILEEN